MTDMPVETIYYPVSLNLTGRPCLVIGGGQVALRKVEGLLEHGAVVRVISPELCPELAALANDGQITADMREYREGDLDGTFLAIIGTDDREINHRAAAEARDKRVLVNVVDDAAECDFIAPSHVRRGAVSIAVSTSGKSPALARKLRTKLEAEFGPEYARLAEVLNDVRSEILRDKIKVSAADWQAAIDLESLLELLGNGEAETARAAVLERLKTGASLSK